MIASPCHHGKVDTQFTLSLLQTCYSLDHADIKVNILLPGTGSILAKERNDILEAFWKSDCTHLLCVDNDLGWDPNTPLKFLNYDKDFVAGVYPARTNNSNSPKFIFRPDIDHSDSIRVDSQGLLKMLAVPAGFMLLSREAIKTMRDAYPNLYYEGLGFNKNFESGYALFNTEIIDGDFWGEDYVFCKKAIDAGIDIWCDPTIEFNHAGTVGKLSEILTNQRPINSDSFKYTTRD